MREYWSDSDLFLRLDSRERETYIGLWMLADDEGWLPRDVPAIAAALYRYEDRAFREGFVRKGLDRLTRLGKVVSHRCCLELPAVAKYPRAGKKTAEHRSEHLNHGPNAKPIRTDLNTGFEPIQTDLNPSPDVTLPNPSLPDVAGARARGGAPRPLKDLLPPPPGYREKATA